MNVLALNASPRGGGQSKTEFLLNHLVQGMEEAGAEVEVVALRKKKINTCVGCFTCWTKTPGVCIHQDDMTRELFPKWLASDLVVYAFPLYHYTVSAAMKTFIERTLPVALPFFEQGEAETYHPLRHDFPKAVILSVAGFPEMSVFDQLSAYVRFLFGFRTRTLVAELYRPAAESLTTSFFRGKGPGDPGGLCAGRPGDRPTKAGLPGDHGPSDPGLYRRQGDVRPDRERSFGKPV